MSVPRLVVAAPASGSGKTTVATGLMAAFSARGLVVSPHKVGPDYIDPAYHALATGRTGRNLDPWLTSEDLIAPLFLGGARGADVAVVEGVMGLYDGLVQGEALGETSGETLGETSGRPAVGAGVSHGAGVNTGFASTAHVAGLLDAPVVLVVDAASVGRSVAATVHGFRTFGDVWIGGVVLNRIGSDRHEEICRAAVEEVGLPVLGVLRRRDDMATPSRHLGLIPAAERRADAVDTIRRLAALISGSCDLDALLSLARSAPALPAEPWDAETHLRDHPPLGRGPVDVDIDTNGKIAKGGERPVVAMAGGRAFTFGYAENVELLEAAGAEVVRFDPLHDETLPEGTRGLVIGGGFPEMYAPELSANEPLRKEITRDITALGPREGRGDLAEAGTGGVPVYAECAGLLYLTRELDGTPMCGVFDATATMTGTLTLGYRGAVAVRDSVVARVGERVRGHEFHRTAVVPGHGPAPAWQWSKAGPEGFVQGNCVASYLHLHWAGSPRPARRFVAACL